MTGYATSPAREGDPVTVQGTTLNGATSVKFGTVAAIIDSISSDGTEIHTHVPVNAVTSLVTVVTPGGTSTGPQFKVLPTITGARSPSWSVLHGGQYSAGDRHRSRVSLPVRSPTR